MTIRDAVEADLPAIVDIYNQSIPAGRQLLARWIGRRRHVKTR